jgi:predicted lipoprotein with Yx(FWY)xxD motif
VEKIATPRTGILVVAALALGLVAAFFVARSTAANEGATMRVVSTAKNPVLGKTVLVNRKGLTLYSLSAERKGKFICTNAACLSFWTPLVVAKGTTPTGVGGLATIKRPNGAIQVTFRGGPLYTFYLDHKRGDAKGEGFKDVGTWHAAAAGANTTPPPAPAPTSGGGYGGYGG